MSTRNIDCGEPPCPIPSVPFSHCHSCDLLPWHRQPYQNRQAASEQAEQDSIQVGQQLPAVALRDIEGKTVSLQDAVKDQPSVVVFYRGGWCPYCRKQLSGLAEIKAEIAQRGWQLIAISPDQASKIAEMTSRKELAQVDYRLLSDAAQTYKPSVSLLPWMKRPDQISRLWH